MPSIPVRLRPRQPKVSQYGTNETTKIVLAILAKYAPQGLSTNEIFANSHTMFPKEPSAAAPASAATTLTPTPPKRKTGRGGLVPTPPLQPLDHPIRSTRYLKLVLKELQQQKLVLKTLVPLETWQMSWVERERAYKTATGPRAWRWGLPPINPEQGDQRSLESHGDGNSPSPPEVAGDARRSC